MSDLELAAYLYRTRQTLSVDVDPVCRVFDCRTDDEVSRAPVLEELAARGCFQVRVSHELTKLNRAAFKVSNIFLNLEEEHALKSRHMIQPGSLNGYHTWGGLSKFNENRW